MKELPELIKTARQKKKLSVRGVADLVNQSGEVKVTGSMINVIELGRKQASYRLVYSLSQVLDINPQQALRAAYLWRIRHCVEKESRFASEFISTLPKGDRVDLEQITRLTAGSF